MGKLEGKVAFITGAARGQGRSHAVRLAQEGADIIAIDICADISTVGYPMATDEDLLETVRAVEGSDRRIIASRVDVRDSAAVKKAIDDGVAHLGRLDIVCANAGIASFSSVEEMTDDVWDDMIGVNLTGVFKTVRAAVPHLRAGGRGGSIVLTSSSAGTKAEEHLAHYTAAKHGVVGLMKGLAKELAKDMIRVNSVLPSSVNTNMLLNEGTYALFRPDMDPTKVTPDDIGDAFSELNLLPVKWMEPIDISNAIAWLVSDEARYVTGIQLPVDAGYIIK